MESNNNNIIKEEVIDVVEYDAEAYGPPPKLPRKYYGEQMIGDQQVFFFYDADSETDESDLDMPRPYKVKVRKVNNLNDQFVCVYPLEDETCQLAPRLPRMKHIKLFDEAMTDRPKPLLTQNLPPPITAVFERVRQTYWLSSVRTAAVAVAFHAPPQRRFLDTNHAFNIPVPQPTLSLSTHPVVPESSVSNENATQALEARLLNSIPELTDADLDIMLQGSPSWYSH